MKKVVLLALIGLLIGCDTSSDKERALIEKEKELLAKERALIEQEKITLKEEKRSKSKVVKADTMVPIEVIDPTDRGIRPGIVRGNGSSKDVTIDHIQQDLLGKKVEYWTTGLIKTKRVWTFAALSEFISTEIENEAFAEGYLEKTIILQMRDLNNGRRCMARMFITYTKFSDGWVMERSDLLSFTQL